MSTVTAQFICPVCEQAAETPGDQPCPHCQASSEWRDVLGAVDFTRKRWVELSQQGNLSSAQYQALANHYDKKRGELVAAARAGQGPPSGEVLGVPPRDRCWDCKKPVDPAQDFCTSCGAAVRSGKVRTLRYLRYLLGEVHDCEDTKRLSLRQSHDLQSEIRERITALKRSLDKERPPEVVLVREAKPSTPRRPLLEILLDPRSIQWLLAGGGALLVLGLVIYLIAVDFFENKMVLAVTLGLGTGALLFGGWAVIRLTRYQMAGRALTLLACLVMPLNIWFYDAYGLILPDGHLWIAALVCCVLYAASALVLKDPLFVYVLAGGLAMTGLLILSDQGVDKFWEIARPATLLVVMGLIAVGAERAFPPSPLPLSPQGEMGSGQKEEGPFTRQRFGMAFFWSGQMLLGGGLLFLLGAQLFGWMHPFFVANFHLRGILNVPPAIVTDHGLKMLALALVLAGMAAYLYSDIVVRRVGIYVYLAIFNLLWAEVLIIGLLELSVAMELVIASLALTALAANLLQVVLAPKVETLSRTGPPLGLFLCSIPVVLGLVLHMRATNGYYHEHWPYQPNWGYVAAMLATAISCRVGAYINRHTMPWLSGIYFLGTATATLVGAAGLLVVLGMTDWTQQVLLLMLIPIVYLIAARLYKGHTAEAPLIHVGHIATAVMALTVLVSVLHITEQVFEPITSNFVNLRVALFFAEAALFYALATILRPKGYNVYLGALMACAAVWQLLTFWDTPAEYYTLAFSVLGFALLVAYRLSLLEQSGLATAGFQSANVLLTLAFAATALLTLRDLAFGNVPLRMLIFLLILQTLLSLLSAWLVQHADWRRWYVVAAIVLGGLTFLVLYHLSTLSLWQKLELFCVALGLFLLVVGHIGWFREQERQQDMVSLSLFLGSVLAALPLVIAVGTYRTQFDTAERFSFPNELGLFIVGLTLLASGVVLQIKSTTLIGCLAMGLDLLGMLLFIRIPEARKTVGLFLAIGGGVLFGTGLLLSIYRDRLLVLPEKIKRREGVFKVLNWR